MPESAVRGGCPVGIDIPTFVRQVAQGDVAAAYHTITLSNLLPSVCGRVCPQESQCEKRCTLAVRFEPVAIGRIERFVGDEAARLGLTAGECGRSNGHRVAVVGSGPAGLTVAADLARSGFAVTVFEALHTAGGVLAYGIPEFRLPKAIVEREIANLERLGVEIRLNQVIGCIYEMDELFTDLGFDAVFVGTGAGLPTLPGVPGINSIGVYSANEYLTRSKLMRADRFPDSDTPPVRGRFVAVIGGGNTAIDAARTAMRLGADRTYLVYRRSCAEMPARAEEVRHAEEEGVELVPLSAPVAIRANNSRRVVALTCSRMRLADADASGRRRPVPIANSEFSLAVDTIVFAVGQGANPLLQSSTPGLRTNTHGYIVANPVTGATGKPRVFAGGDVVTGGATVISAMGAGRRAAHAICALLTGKEG